MAAKIKERIIYNADVIIKKAMEAKITQKEIANEICHVSEVTVSRWKNTGRAKASAIRPLATLLVSLLESESENELEKKFLNDSSIEDLAWRARQLGFRATFEDINK